MTIINSVATQNVSTNTASQTSSGLGKSVDYDAFLTLMMAQMRNQDPTNPTDSKDNLAQLASFSQVEQGIKTNEKLDQMLRALSMNEAAGFVGREIISADGEIGGQIVSVTLRSEGLVANLANGKALTLGEGVTVY